MIKILSKPLFNRMLFRHKPRTKLFPIERVTLTISHVLPTGLLPSGRGYPLGSRVNKPRTTRPNAIKTPISRPIQNDSIAAPFTDRTIVRSLTRHKFILKLAFRTFPPINLHCNGGANHLRHCSSRRRRRSLTHLSIGTSSSSRRLLE